MWIELKMSGLSMENICLQCYASKQWIFASFSVHLKNQDTITTCNLNVVKYDYFHNFYFIFQAKDPSNLFHFLFFLLFLLFLLFFSFSPFSIYYEILAPELRRYTVYGFFLLSNSITSLRTFWAETEKGMTWAISNLNQLKKTGIR